MSLDPLTAALEAGKAILDKVWPDAGEMERSKVQMALAIYAGQVEIVKAKRCAHPAVVFRVYNEEGMIGLRKDRKEMHEEVRAALDSEDYKQRY